MTADPDARFATTRWTRVVAARGDSTLAGDALGSLCEAYYSPVEAFIRARVGDAEAARDLTQEFFARVLRGGAFDGAEPTRGRFRSFLLGAVKHFLADTRATARASKRGGGAPAVSLDAGTDTSPGLDPPDPHALVEDAVFDQQWAISVLDRALKTLESEFKTSGKAEHFAVLKLWLTGFSPVSRTEAATSIGLNENAFAVAIHRLRKRFREIVKTDIAQTVIGAEEQQAELRHLIAALASDGR